MFSFNKLGRGKIDIQSLLTVNFNFNFIFLTIVNFKLNGGEKLYFYNT